MAVGALVGVGEGSCVGVAEGTGVAVAVGTGDDVEVLSTLTVVGVLLTAAVATTVAPSATTVPEMSAVTVRATVLVIALGVGMSVGVGAVVEVAVGGGKVGVGLTNSGALAGVARSWPDSPAVPAMVWAVAVAGDSRLLSSAPAEGPPLLRKISHNRIRATTLATPTGASGRQETSFRPQWGQMLR